MTLKNTPKPNPNVVYEYDYGHKCDCSDDDNCGCSYPNNCSHDYDFETIKDTNPINSYSSCSLGEEECYCNRVMVGEFTPNFIASAVMPDNKIIEDFNLSDYLDGDYGYIFFYPLDFTYVCPSELIAHNNRLEEFKKRHVKILSISVDSVYTHLAWKKTPLEKGGVGDLNFPLVSDLTKDICHDFGVLNEDGIALRGTFILDRDGIIRHQMINDIPLGRNVDESLRIIDALQSYEKNGNVCPAGWTPGNDTIPPTPEGVGEFLKKNSHKL